MHYASQNHKRLHFGLANYTLIDSVVMYWPSGIVNEVKDVPVDQIILLKEPEIPLAPKQQMSFGISATEVLCKDGLELVFKTATKAGCVKSTTLLKLIERGWLKKY